MTSFGRRSVELCGRVLGPCPALQSAAPKRKRWHSVLLHGVSMSPSMQSPLRTSSDYFILFLALSVCSEKLKGDGWRRMCGLS